MNNNNNNSNATNNFEVNVVCPNCGTELTISSKQRTEPAKKRMTASEKIEALKKAGVNTSSLFAMGTDTIVRNDGSNSVSVVPEDDPIFQAILKQGYIANPTLYRRWVMSQVFHMMAWPHNHDAVDGFTAALNAKSYRYMWKMIVNEYAAQSAMFRHGDQHLAERTLWFGCVLVYRLCSDYIDQLHTHIKDLPVKHCKGIAYKRIGGKNIFVTDINDRIFKRLEVMRSRVLLSENSVELAEEVAKFYALVKGIYFSNDFKVPAHFKDAYKGAGAYFTLKNLFLFHGAAFVRKNQVYHGDAALDRLNFEIVDQSLAGYEVLGVLRQVLRDNKIDVEKKIAEWRKK